MQKIMCFGGGTMRLYTGMQVFFFLPVSVLSVPFQISWSCDALMCVLSYIIIQWFKSICPTHFSMINPSIYWLLYHSFKQFA